MKKLSWIVVFFSFNLWANQDTILTFKNDSLDLLQELKKVSYLVHRNDFSLQPTLSIKPNRFGYKELLFYLNCEAENPQFLKDEVGRYNLIKKNLFLVNEKVNQFACYFKNRDHLILLETRAESWPYTNNQTFSISFWFKPLIPLKEQNLMEWSTFTESKIKKFNIYLNKNALELNLLSVLKKEEQSIDLTLTLSKIDFEEWNHFFMSVDLQNKNRIIIYLNGKLIKSIHLPKKVEWDFESLHYAPIQIGGKYIGYIDEFMILKDFYPSPITYNKYPGIDLNPNSGRVNQKTKELFLPPISIPASIDHLKLILDYERPEGTFLKIQYAILDDLNRPTLWKDLPLQEEWVWDSSQLGKYLQFRVLMLQDSEGKNAPAIKKFLLEKKEFSNIPQVHQLRIVKELSNHHQICLEWQKVPEEIIEEKGGYNIHIGIKKYDFELVISELYYKGIWQKINKKNTDFPTTEQEKELERIRPNYWKQYKNNHIRVILTKDLLYQLVEKQLEKNQLSIDRIKLIFEDNVTYYVSVSAYIKEPQIRGKLSLPVSFHF